MGRTKYDLIRDGGYVLSQPRVQQPQQPQQQRLPQQPQRQSQPQPHQSRPPSSQLKQPQQQKHQQQRPSSQPPQRSMGKDDLSRKQEKSSPPLEKRKRTEYGISTLTLKSPFQKRRLIEARENDKNFSNVGGGSDSDSISSCYNNNYDCDYVNDGNNKWSPRVIDKGAVRTHTKLNKPTTTTTTISLEKRKSGKNKISILTLPNAKRRLVETREEDDNIFDAFVRGSDSDSSCDTNKEMIRTQTKPTTTTTTTTIGLFQNCKHNLSFVCECKFINKSKEKKVCNTYYMIDKIAVRERFTNISYKVNHRYKVELNFDDLDFDFEEG
eukprot:Pgem_evm1s1856